MNCCSIVEAPCTVPLCADVLDERARDAADVDAAVGLKALVLDRDHRLLDDRRDLRGRDDHAVLLADDAERVAEVVEQDRALGVLELRELRQRRQVGGDGDEDAEHERDEARAPGRRGGSPGSAASSGGGPPGGSGCSGRSSSLISSAIGDSADGRRIRSRWRGPRERGGGRRWDPPEGESLALAPMPNATDAAAEDPARLAAWLARNAVDSLPEGALAEQLRRRARRAARCASSWASTRPRRTSTSATRSSCASCASSRTPATGWC